MWKNFFDELINQGAYKRVLEGLLHTAEIAILGLLIGIVIGTLIAIVKVMPQYKWLPRVLSKCCDAYVALFRGTPMVVQLLIGYWILLPALGIGLNELLAAIVIFGLNSGAYVSEIMRSGIQSVDSGQMEAGRAVGLGYWTTMAKVVIPQSVKNILPTLGNEFIMLVKDTSVVSFIAVTDLTVAFKALGSDNYEYTIPYLMLAAIYLVIVGLITLGIRALERRFKRNERTA